MRTLPILTTILRYIRRGPVTRRYPAVPAKEYAATRGHLEFTIDDCIFCGLCRMHCPSQALEVSKPDLTWQIDRFRCIICGACVEYCPKDCLAIRTDYLPPVTGPVTERHQAVGENRQDRIVEAGE